MKQLKAFTMIELLVILFLFVLFSGLSMSSLFSWIKSTQIKTDSATCLEMKNIITKGVKSGRISFDVDDYSIKWDSSNKGNIRNLLVSEMGKISKSNTVMIKKPKQDGYAFFVYLLPPYTVIPLPINSIANIDIASKLQIDSTITDKFLSQRYSKNYYPQMYRYESSNGTLKFERPYILDLGATVTPGLKHSYVGCINTKEDFD